VAGQHARRPATRVDCPPARALSVGAPSVPRRLPSEAGGAATPAFRRPAEAAAFRREEARRGRLDGDIVEAVLRADGHG